jgi:hypothetical protein
VHMVSWVSGTMGICHRPTQSMLSPTFAPTFARPTFLRSVTEVPNPLYIGAGVGTHDMRTLFTDETLVAPLASFVHNMPKNIG